MKKKIFEKEKNTKTEYTKIKNKKIERLKKIQVISIVVCVIMFLGYAFYLFKPKIHEFNYVDECGIMPGGNGITHTIASEDMCKNACYGYCLSKEKEMTLDKIYFEEQQGKCNICRCYCRIL